MSKDTKKEKVNNENFIKGVKGELKKVTWPTGKELLASTSTVIFITIMLAAIVFVLDFAFEKANTYGIDKLKAAVVTETTEENNSETTPVEGTPEVAPTEAPVEETAEPTVAPEAPAENSGEVVENPAQ